MSSPTSIRDKGPWRARSSGSGDAKRWFLESDDFTHDVRLYLNGDFADDAQRQAYLDDLARRLNAGGEATLRKGPQVGETWHVRLPDSGTLVPARVEEVTALTILLAVDQPSGGRRLVRCARGKVEFVEAEAGSV